MLEILAQTTELVTQFTAEEAVEVARVTNIWGSISKGIGALGGAIAVGIIGYKACESVGRNPGAAGPVLTQSIIAMALAEGVAILSLILG
jgi:F-type H+-transporting ATPase subunit c